MIFHDVPQNTDEWDALRCGRITSSKLGVVMANYGKAFGDPARKYAIDIATEQITKKKTTGGYSNDDMARGHEDEPLAIMEYSNEYFCDVMNGGFYELDDYGCSPDGRVKGGGLIECKSAIPSVHFERIRKESCDSTTYLWQMIGNMKAAKEDWIDFISYCGAFPEGKKIYVIKYCANRFVKEYDMIDARLEEFRELIKESKEIILSSSYHKIY